MTDLSLNKGAWDLPSLADQHRLRSVAWHVGGVLLAMLVWGLSSCLLAKDFQGFAPVPTVSALIRMVPTKHFWISTGASMGRLLAGLAIAVCIGMPVGIAIGYFRRVNDLTYVLFQFLRMVSPLSWMPIAIILFGVGTGPVVFLVAIAAVWPMVISTAQGVQQVEDIWVQVARTLGAGHLGVLRRVVIPAVLPDILTGIRVALGVSWIVLVPAEMLGVSSGLGYLILDYRDVVDYASLMAVILVIGFVGYVSDQIVRLLLKRFSWQA